MAPSASDPAATGNCTTTSSVSPSAMAEDRVQVLGLLHQPDHLLGLVAEVLGRRGQAQEAPQLARLHAGAGRPQHPQLEPVVHLVEAVLEVADLGRQDGIAQHEGRIGQADGRLGQVLHLDEHVDGAVEVGERALLLAGDGRVPGAARRPAPGPG